MMHKLSGSIQRRVCVNQINVLIIINLGLKRSDSDAVLTICFHLVCRPVVLSSSAFIGRLSANLYCHYPSHFSVARRFTAGHFPSSRITAGQQGENQSFDLRCTKNRICKGLQWVTDLTDRSRPCELVLFDRPWYTTSC